MVYSHLQLDSKGIMFYQRKIKNYQLIGLLIFIVFILYLFSVFKKSHPFVEKLKDFNDESQNQDSFHADKLHEYERIMLARTNYSKRLAQMPRDPMGVIIQHPIPANERGSQRENQPGFLKSLTERIFGRTSFNHRIVHLDLKGAPPKMDYLISILPLMKTLGATGILIEYEDMFPYRNELEILSAFNSYKPNEIEGFLRAAKKNNLEVIPLIQTFGHMEFALKLKEYSSLREVPSYPQVICPLRNGSFSLITKILDQVLAMHPGLNWIHMGSDEVYNIGECHLCQEYSLKRGLDRDDLFLQHALRVATYIKDKYDVQPIMWDDEFRKIPLGVISQSNIAKYVEIMVWQYNPGILARIGNDIWEKYSKVFDGVWVASAFKGAASPDSFLTDINERLSNNKEWVEVVELYKSSINFRGIVLTGWQRFDHFAVLCELFPQAIPSLAVSLMYIMNKKADHTALSSVGDSLGCNTLLNLDLKYLDLINTCQYTGAKTYEIAQRLYTLKKEISEMMDGNHIKGWITDYNINNNFASPQMVEIGLQDLSMLLFEFKKMYTDAKLALRQVYDEHTVKEWVALNLDADAKKLNSLYQARNELLMATSWPRRPLNAASDKEL